MWVDLQRTHNHATLSGLFGYFTMQSVTLCSNEIEIACCLLFQIQKFSWTAYIWKIEADRFSNISLILHQSTRHQIPGDVNLHQQHWQNLISCNITCCLKRIFQQYFRGAKAWCPRSWSCLCFANHTDRTNLWLAITVALLGHWSLRMNLSHG